MKMGNKKRLLSIKKELQDTLNAVATVERRLIKKERTIDIDCSVVKPEYSEFYENLKKLHVIHRNTLYFGGFPLLLFNIHRNNPVIDSSQDKAHVKEFVEHLQQARKESTDEFSSLVSSRSL